MAGERIQVAYSRKVSLQVSDGKFETISLGGSVEFDVNGEQWQDAYEGAYVTYKLIVDQLLDESLPKPTVAAALPPVEPPHVVNNVATLPGESIAPKPAGSSWTTPPPPPVEIVANAPVAFTHCKVFNVDVKMGKNGEWAKIRIGNRDQIPNQYTTAKSFEPQIVARLKALNEGDYVDVAGYFTPWQIDASKFDLVVQRIDRSQA